MNNDSGGKLADNFSGIYRFIKKFYFDILSIETLNVFQKDQTLL